MKKVLLCLFCFMLVFAVAACGGETATDDSAADTATTDAAADTATADTGGVLADFTADATVVTNEEARTYAQCFFDYDEDGVEELFYIEGLADDAAYPMRAAIFTGADTGSNRWNPNAKFDDVAEVKTVCFIDINPDDGGKDLVISTVGKDGAEQTMILQGLLENTDAQFGNVWKDGAKSSENLLPGLFRSFEDGKLTIGDTVYEWEEGYWLKVAE